jgi:hypothetical protein
METFQPATNFGPRKDGRMDKGSDTASSQELGLLPKEDSRNIKETEHHRDMYGQDTDRRK